MADWWGCAWYRCHVPGLELKRRGHSVVLDDAIDPEGLKEFDVVVFQRQCSEASWQAIQYVNSLGKLSVYELDDDLWHIDRTNPAFSYWTPEKLRGVESCIAESQVVTTTTPYLAERLTRFNKKIFILPNMLPKEQWQLSKKAKDNRKLVLGWAGGTSHWPDLRILEGTIEQLLDDYTEIEFHIAGAGPVPFKKHERLKGLESVKIEQYPKLLSGFDVGLAPLVDTQFNRAKSDLKFLEYAMAGLAVVASKVESYKGSIIHGQNGFMAKNTKDWIKYLKRLIEDAELRQRIATNARQFAETRTIESNIWMWERAYGITPRPV
ncbi:MAG: glycosyltransferase [Actinomycetota bacterium]